MFLRASAQLTFGLFSLMGMLLVSTGPARADTDSSIEQISRADADSVFERIKGLAGRWEGATYWSSEPSMVVDANVTYFLTGRGSAVVENFSTGTQPTMTSVYHRDGDDVRMTHFCSAKNQPRLKATHIDDEKGVVSFSFVDITNLAGPGAGHVSSSEFHFQDDDHMVLKFTFSKDGRDIYEVIELTRVPESNSSD